MAGNKYLLDTNIVIPILNRNADVLKRIEGQNLYIPVIVLGELDFGARRSDQAVANLARIEIFKKRCAILVCDEDSTGMYGQIKERLAAKGRLIPDNDIWIAAIGMQHSLIVVTRDEHFQEIDGLKTERW